MSLAAFSICSVFLALAAFYPQRVQADDASLIHAASLSGEAGDILKLLGPPSSCANLRRHRRFGIPDELFWKNVSCTQLFSNTPPQDLHSPVSVWRPFCSLTLMNRYYQNKKRPRFAAALADQASEIKSNDLCASGPASMRGQAGYVDDSQEEDQVTIMSDSDRTQYFSRVQEARSVSAQVCCGKDETCSNWMNNVQISFCKPQDDPKKPDPCVENGTQFDIPNSTTLSAFFDKYSNAVSGGDKLVIPPGEITLSPFNDKNGNPNDDMDTVLHELGHACSFIQRTLQLQSGSQSAYQEVKASQIDDSKGCSLDDGFQPVYQTLFAKIGFSPETLSCAMDYSSQAVNQRFSSQACSKGCPGKAIEEHFADLMSYRSLQEGDATRAMKKLCDYERDDQHPLMSDVVECAMKTPQLAQRFEDWTGCQ